MSVSTLNFSATLPPFNYTSGYNNNYSNSNLSATGNLAIATAKDNSTGSTTTTITSSINSNGVSYAENSATLNGDLLTVNYTSSTVPSTIESNLNGTGVDFTPKSATINGNAVTTSYGTAANANFDLAVSQAAISTATSDTGQNIVLKSLAVVGNSLTATYQLTSDLPNSVTLAPNNAPPPQTAIVTAQEPSAVNLGHTGPTFQSAPISTIGDVLAASNGISFSGSVAGAVQPPGLGPSTGFSASNSTLAAVLNPNVSFSPSSSLQITDFIDTGTSTNAPSAPTDISGGNNNSSAFGSPGKSSTDGLSNFSNSNTNNSSTSTNATASTGIYNAVANASASNIRGAGVDTVA